MIRIGIIGAGGNATGHARYYHQSPRTDVVAVADPVSDLAQKLADEVDAKPVDDYTKFLDEVDAVVVSSPNFLHVEHAVACAQAGKHVYCEKPMGLNLDQAKRIVDAIDKAGVKSQVGFAVRNSGFVQTMRKMLEAGDFGELVSVWSRRLHFMQPGRQTGWRADPAKSGGLLLEINIHELDWMMYLAGEVQSVYARMRATETQGERANDHLWITLNFANDAVGLHEGSWHAAPQNFFRGLHGNKGGAQTDEWGNQLLVTLNGQQRHEPSEYAHAYDIRGNFLDQIEHDAEPYADVHQAMKVMRVAEACFVSAADNRVVDLASL